MIYTERLQTDFYHGYNRGYNLAMSQMKVNLVWL